jgi:hypothetical protein
MSKTPENRALGGVLGGPRGGPGGSLWGPGGLWGGPGAPPGGVPPGGPPGGGPPYGQKCRSGAAPQGGPPGGHFWGGRTRGGQNKANSSLKVVYSGGRGGPPQKRTGCAPCRGAQKGPNFRPLWVFLPLFCGRSHHVSPQCFCPCVSCIIKQNSPRRLSGERPQLGDGVPKLALGGPPGGVPRASLDRKSGGGGQGVVGGVDLGGRRVRQPQKLGSERTNCLLKSHEVPSFLTSAVQQIRCQRNIPLAESLL